MLNPALNSSKVERCCKVALSSRCLGLIMIHAIFENNIRFSYSNVVVGRVGARGIRRAASSTSPLRGTGQDVESKLPLSARVARLLASTSQSYQVQQSFCGDIQLHLTNANANANAIRQALTNPSRSHVCSALQSSINWGPPIFLCLESWTVLHLSILACDIL